jgi:hypothetical protein
MFGVLLCFLLFLDFLHYFDIFGFIGVYSSEQGIRGLAEGSFFWI